MTILKPVYSKTYRMLTLRGSGAYNLAAMLFIVFAGVGLSAQSAQMGYEAPKKEPVAPAKVQSYYHNSPRILVGGPDGFGYMYYSTQDGDTNVTFNWIDISTTGTAVGATDDWCSGSSESTLYPLGFFFPYYEQTRDSISICSNGTIVLENLYSYQGLSNTALPGSNYGMNGFIAVMWDDLNPAASGADDIYFQSFSSCPDGYAGACAVIQYHNVPRYGGSIFMNFEAILYDNGDIKLQYNSTIDYNDATIGIQDSTAADTLNPSDWYLEYVYNGSPSTHVPDSGTAILFKYPPPPDHDIAVNAIILPHFDFYTFYPVGQEPTWPQTGDVVVIIENRGANDESGFDLTLDLNGNISTVTGLSLTAGSTDNVVFSGLSIMDVNTATAYHNLATDERPSNDTATASMDYSALYRVVGDTITYADTLDATDAIGSSSDLGASRIAVKFDSSDLYLFTGKYIKGIFFYHCWPGATSGCISGGNNAVAIYPDAGGVPDHNNALFRKDIGDIGTTPGLIYVPIDTIAATDTAALHIGTFPFYVAREIQTLNNGYPFGVDNGPCFSGRGCWISADNIGGGAWAELTNYGLDYNWILGIVVSSTPDYVGKDEAIIVPGDAKLVRGIFDGYLVLNAPAERDMTIEMYNTAGKMVKKIEVRKGLTRVPAGKLPSGAYFYITSDGKAGSIIVR